MKSSKTDPYDLRGMLSVKDEKTGLGRESMDKKNNTTLKMILRGALAVVILLLSLTLFRNQDEYASAGFFPAALMLAWTVCER